MDRRAFLALAAVTAGATGLAAFSSRARAMPEPSRVRRLALTNAHTGETFSGPYRDAVGPITTAMQDLSAFLRDFHCGESIPIDVSLFDFLRDVLDTVGATRATVLSGYRTPATNAMLARTMFGVAEHSQHIYGRALDFCVPTRLEDAMWAARAMRRGGVGWYPHSGFIHLDTGPVRNWTLEGAGFAPLLLDGGDPLRREPIAISPSGKLVASRTGRPVSVSDRLAIHRLLEKATRQPAKG
jgi:uncharacterized protein YcbK (DUF882 family)